MLRPASPVQSTYAQYHTPGQNGMPATMTGWDIDTRLAEEPAGTGIPFGRAVCQGLQSTMAATLGALSGGEFVGITRADPTLPNVNTTYTDKYSDGENMAVMVRGDMWVIPATNVTAGGDVYFNSSTGELGASGISNAVKINNAKWVTSYPETDIDLVVTGQLAIVRLTAVS
jgi:hypothetical protein